MSNSSPALRSYCAEDFLSAENLNRADQTVTEIFQLMFGFEIAVVEAGDGNLPSDGQDERTAVVGFSGPMRGSCHVRIRTEGARSIASAMLGGVEVEEDDSIDDALGELCNMLAGGWKNGIAQLSSACTLSPPTVISGPDYKVYVRKPSVKLSRTYQFESHVLHLTIYCEDAGVPSV